jgi:VIT1/CCC1 family predicted Fe2+/Mn2+ transporter
VIPVAPFFFLGGSAAIVTSLALAAAALFGLGGGISLLTGRGALFSGARQMLLGLAAAGITFAVGRLLSVAVGG